MKKLTVISILAFAVLSCKKDGNRGIVTNPPFTMQTCLNILGLEYSRTYPYMSEAGTIIGTIRIHSDTTIVEHYNGVDYTNPYSFASNNDSTMLVMTFKAKNRDFIQLGEGGPVTKMAKNEFFQIIRYSNSRVVVSGRTAMNTGNSTYPIKRQ